jgi:hypothetical protein
MSQAYAQAINDYGSPEGWIYEGENQMMSADNVLNKLAPYLKIIKTCPYTDAADCFAGYTAENLTGTSRNNLSTNSGSFGGRAVLSDGTLMFIYSAAGACITDVEDSCGGLYIDINGFDKPNAHGKDIFFFSFMRNGTVRPGGQPGIEGNTPFQGACVALGSVAGLSSNYGKGCTAWVIHNENMDYLHCDDLSWNGKTKCD